MNTGTPNILPPPWRVEGTAGTAHVIVVDSNGLMVCSCVTKEIAEFIVLACNHYVAVPPGACKLVPSGSER